MLIRDVPEIVIRAAEPGDAEAIFDLFNGPLAQSNTLQVPWTSLEQRRRRLLEPDPDSPGLVATIDGRVVGMLGLHIEGRRPRRRDTASFGMAVHDDSRIKGWVAR